MSDIRLVQADEMENAIRLADSVFRDDEHISMGKAFPSVFSISLKQSYGAFEDGELVSFLGFVPAIVQIGSARLNIFSVGAVCTHPNARGKGYASKLMSSVISHANEANASLILVSGNRTLYTRFACIPFGSLKRYSLNQDNMAPIILGENHITVREWRPTDLFKLVELARTRTAFYEQGVTDLAGLIYAASYASNLKMQHKVLIAEEQGKCLAFAVIALPGDKSTHRVSFVVEHAGDATAIATLLKQALQIYNLSQLDVPVNWYETELNETLCSKPNKLEQNSGTVHVVNVDHLNEQLRPYLDARDESNSDIGNVSTASALQIENLDDKYKVVLRNQPPVIVDDAGLVAFLFDPSSAGSRHSHYFPLPFPYTVGLNYV